MDFSFGVCAPSSLVARRRGLSDGLEPGLCALGLEIFSCLLLEKIFVLRFGLSDLVRFKKPGDLKLDKLLPDLPLSVLFLCSFFFSAAFRPFVSASTLSWSICTRVSWIGGGANMIAWELS